MSFAQFRVSNLKKNITSIINRNATLAADIQKAIMAAADKMQETGDTSYLTMLVVGLSNKGAEGQVILTAQAQQIGKYAKDHLPVRWDKETQAFKMKKGWADFEWDEAATIMEALRWDAYQNVKADKAFDADKEWAAIVAKVKRILRTTPKDKQDAPAYRNAEMMAKNFAITIEA